MPQFYDDCPFCGQVYTYSSGELAECPCYKGLFVDLATYLLPDGTEVQAIWDGSGGWILSHHDNPRDPNAWHMQYEVQRNGPIVAVRYAGQLRVEALSELPKVELSEYWPTDLSIEDFRHVADS